MKESREGVQAAGSFLTSEAIADRTYWFAPPTGTRAGRPSAAYLLPNYDECLIAYKDRGSVIDRPSGPPGRDVYNHHVLIGDRVVGSWKRMEKTRESIEVHVHRPLTVAESRALTAAGRAYSDFVTRPVAIVVVSSDTGS